MAEIGPSRSANSRGPSLDEECASTGEADLAAAATPPALAAAPGPSSYPVAPAPSASAAALATAAATEAASAVAGGHAAGSRTFARGIVSAMSAGRSAARRGVLRGMVWSDRAMLSLVWRRGSVPEPLPVEAMLQVRALRRPALGCAAALTAAVGSQLWVAAESVMLLDQGVPKDCVALQDWLLAYQGALPNLPFLFLVAAPMLLWWAVSGLRQRSQLPASCKEQDPELWDFVLRAFICTLTTFVSLLILFLVAWQMKRQIRQIQRLWSGGGPTVDAVRRQVVDGPDVDVPPDTECTICLETRASTDEGWRALPCGHHFHRPCLLQWLLRSHRCPLCRCDLHAVYLSRGRSLSPEVARERGLSTPLSSTVT